MSVTHPYFPMVVDINLGQIMFTPCPGTREVDLFSSLKQLATAGASALLTLMPAEEMQKNGVTAIPEQCAHLGLLWFHLPIEDDHAPDQTFTQEWENARSKIHELLTTGKSIAIHCKGGTGRTGVVAAQILLERGLAQTEVVQRVRSVRPNALSIGTQMAYIEQLAGKITGALCEEVTHEKN